MQPLTPSYIADIRMILINRIPSLTEEDLDILVDIFLTTH